MADSLEKTSKKLVDRYLRAKPAPVTKKSNNYTNYNQSTETKEEQKYSLNFYSLY